MKKIIMALSIMCMILLAGCNNEIVCNKPYIQIGNECCLDKDNNSICDADETIEEKVKEKREEVEREVNEKAFKVKKILSEELGYDVINVDEGIIQGNQSYARVMMEIISTESLLKVQKQIIEAEIIMYLAWDDKDMYIVTMDDGYEICSTIIHNQALVDLSNENLSDEEWYEAISLECI